MVETMSITSNEHQSSPCPECNGSAVEFRGTGSDLEYKVCSRYREPGHIDLAEIRAKIAEQRMSGRPSGRFA